MAHTACDSNRPCARCSALGKEDTCVDVERKKRGRPKNLGEGGSDYTQASQGLEIKAEPSQSSSAALGGGFPYQSMVQEAIKRQRAGTASPKQSRFYFFIFNPILPSRFFSFQFICLCSSPNYRTASMSIFPLLAITWSYLNYWRVV
jgi:hypothetical protein